MKTGRLKKSIAILTVSALAVLSAVLCAACAGTKAPPPVATVTVAFMDGDRLISSVVGNAGDPLAPPTAEQVEKAGYSFDGWYDNAQGVGNAVVLPDTIPENDTSYYAKYTDITGDEQDKDTYKIIYDKNSGSFAHGGELTPSIGKTGETVKLKDGRDYRLNGYRFLGWTEVADYVYSENTPFEPYLAGDEFEISDKDVTLYAQWAAAYSDADGKSDDVIYVFDPLIDRGLGAAIYSSAGKPDQLGFVASSESTGLSYNVFEFNYDDGTVTGRLNVNYTYDVLGDEAGQYLYRDYVAGDGPDALGGAYLTLDGYGVAVYIEQLGDQIAVRARTNTTRITTIICLNIRTKTARAANCILL